LKSFVRARARLITVSLVLVYATTASAEAPRKILSYDSEACTSAMHRFIDQNGATGLDDIVRRCSVFYGAEDCRASWERSLTIKGPEGRLPIIVNGCTWAYCASLSPRPKLCASKPRWLNRVDVAAQWPEFQRAIFTHELGAEAGRRLEPIFTSLLMTWTRTSSELPASKRVLHLVKTRAHTELELRDERGRRMRRWTFDDMPDGTQLQELREQAEQFPKVSGEGTFCARIDADPRIKFRQMRPIIQALTEGHCENYSLSLLLRMPAPAPDPHEAADAPGDQIPEPK
jgi:hypothetical protein